MAKHFPRSSRKGHPFQNTLPKSHPPKTPLPPVCLAACGQSLPDMVKRTGKLPRSQRAAGAALLYALKYRIPAHIQPSFPLKVPLPGDKEHWAKPEVQRFVEEVRLLNRSRIHRQETTERRRSQFELLYGGTVVHDEVQYLVGSDSIMDALRYMTQVANPPPPVMSMGCSGVSVQRELLVYGLTTMWRTRAIPLESEMQRAFSDEGERRFVWQYALATDYRLKVDGASAIFHEDSLYYPGLTAILLASHPDPPSEEMLRGFAATPPEELKQAENDVLRYQLAVLRDPIEYTWTRDKPWLVELIWKVHALPDLEVVLDWRSFQEANKPAALVKWETDVTISPNWRCE